MIGNLIGLIVGSVLIGVGINAWVGFGVFLLTLSASDPE